MPKAPARGERQLAEEELQRHVDRCERHGSQQGGDQPVMAPRAGSGTARSNATPSQRLMMMRLTTRNNSWLARNEGTS